MNDNVINIALLGNTNTEYLGKAISSQCIKYGIEANIYNAPFKQYNQVILDNRSSFYASKPELTILSLEGRELFADWYNTSDLLKEKAVKEDMVNNMLDTLKQSVEAIHAVSSTKIIINNIRVPYHSPLGILDSKINPGLKQMITLLNLKLEECLSDIDYAYMFDLNGFCSYAGQCDMLDEKMYYLAGNSLSFPSIKLLAGEYMRYILPLKSKNKKCLVLDLDNTLWGGIAGEDSIAGIKLDLSGEGNCFYNFQKEILNLYNKGIILAVNSKNNASDVLEIIENHPHMLLRKKHFSCLKINWQDKYVNLKEISSELNIGLDSLVFIDDNPVERDYVRKMLPEVSVVDLPSDSSKYCRALHNIVELESLSLTAEDKKRNEMYEQSKKRSQLQQSFQSKEEYLESLQTSIKIIDANEFNIQRIAQMTQKTNQFNMTTKRYQAEDLKKMLESGNYLAYCCSAADKFGDNGITGCCIIKKAGSQAHIDSFLLSCRVLGRNIEYAFLSYIVDLLKNGGIQKITAEYLPTEKNGANCDFYLTAGFTPVSAGKSRTLYSLDKGPIKGSFDYIKVL